LTRFLALRLLQALAVLALVSVAVYGLIGLMPGDPIDLMVASDPRLTPGDAARLRALYGLDVPLWERYLNWAGAALSGDLGFSRLFARPVPEVVLPRLGNTLLLLVPAFAIALALAFPLALRAARAPGGAADTAIGLLCFAGISMPPFWLALLLMMLFAVHLGWLPAGGMGPPAGGGGARDLLAHMALPVATLALLSVGGYTRYLRAGLLEQLRQDYVRTARAKGASEGRVLWRHALRNALLPVVTLVGLDLGTLVSGALVVETMFAWPGMGKLTFDAVMGNDYNLALACLLLATGTTLLGNLLADAGYAALDPRVAFGARRT
jgi:peptide/nickel transport system permease protein